MTADLAAGTNGSAFLDFDKSPDFRLITDFASVQIDEGKHFHIAPELDIGGDANPHGIGIRVHAGMS
jgi:hypothetical protein